jgi:hypothetical protein
VRVTDTQGRSATSAPVQVSVSAAPIEYSLTPQTASGTATAPVTVGFTANASGGSGEFDYDLTVNGSSIDIVAHRPELCLFQ